MIRSNKVIAASPLSGYLSITAYVPYTMWHEADPRKMAMVLASLNSHKHELLATNLADIPIYQQHGTEDDNVPVFHSRRMHQIIAETGWSSQYSEILGQGHWWKDVMTYGFLAAFLGGNCGSDNTNLPSFKKVSLVVAGPGSKGIVVVDQLEEPDRYHSTRFYIKIKCVC